MDRATEQRRATLTENAEPAAAAHAARPAGETGCTETAEVAEARRRALEDLRWNWDEAYEIGWYDGRFRAERLDGRGVVDAATAQELRDLILADYTACPVPRDYQKDPAAEE